MTVVGFKVEQVVRNKKVANTESVERYDIEAETTGDAALKRNRIRRYLHPVSHSSMIY